MYINVTETMFIEEFRKMNRMDNFSCDGLKALYEFFTDLEEDTGGSIECDVISICCDWSEDTVEDIVNNYALALYPEDVDVTNEEYMAENNLEDIVEAVIEALNYETIAFDVGNGRILYQVF